MEEKVPSVIWSAEPSRCFSGRTQAQRGRTTSKMVKMGWRKQQGSAKRDQFASEASLGLPTKIRINDTEGMCGAPRTSGKSFLVDHGGPERSWSTTQHHGPAGAPGPPLDHLDPAWTTSCNHTPEIAVQGGSRWTRGTTGTMELGGGPGALWSHFYILLMYFWNLTRLLL